MPSFDIPKSLATWARNSLHAGENILASSNQGTVLLFQQDGIEYVIKAAMGQGAVLRARQATLDREYRAYERLQGISGIPRCHGMLDDEFLVLDYVHGVPYREASISNREVWFAELLQIIRACHDRGVAHGDLKTKGNLMSTTYGRPCVIDFGTTVLFEEGFHPFNNRMFNYACQLDLNAWVKHKYQGRYEDASGDDRKLLKDGFIERSLRRWRRRNWSD